MRACDAISDSLGGQTLLAVLEALVGLNWTTSGYRRTRSFDDVLLQRDRREPALAFTKRLTAWLVSAPDDFAPRKP